MAQVMVTCAEGGLSAEESAGAAVRAFAVQSLPAIRALLPDVGQGPAPAGALRTRPNGTTRVLEAADSPCGRPITPMAGAGCESNGAPAGPPPRLS